MKNSDNRARFYALAGLALFLFLSVSGLFLPLGRDGGNFLLIGGELLRGAVPYAEIWDNKPPAVWVIYALAAAFGGGVRRQELIVAFFSFGALAFSLLSLYRAQKGNFFNYVIPALVLPIGMSYWLMGQAEVFALCFSAIGWLAFRRYTARPDASAAALTGICWGCLALFKPQFILIGLLPIVALPRLKNVNEPLKNRLLMWLSFILPFVIIFVWLFITGSLSAAAEAVITFNIRYSQSPFPLWHYIPLLFRAMPLAGLVLIFLSCLAVIKIFKRSKDGAARAASLWFIGSLAAVIFAGRYWLYHWLICIPPAAALAGSFADYVKKAYPRFYIPYFLIILFAALPASLQPAYDLIELKKAPHGSFIFSEDALNNYSRFEIERAAGVLRRLSPKGARVQLFGYDGMLYVLAERRPASRFFYDFPLVMLPEDDPLGRKLRSDFLDDMKKRPPAVVIAAINDINPVEKLDSLSQLRSYGELREWLEENYKLSAQTRNFIFFSRIEKH